MGTFDTGGIAAELAKFDGLRQGTEAACERAVQAGGRTLAERLKEAAPVYKGFRTDLTPGALRDSIRAGKVKYSAADGYHCEVGPTGSDHGEPLAKIGNILEYGRSNMDPQPWFNTTVEDYGGDVITAMQKAFREAQEVKA